MTISEITKNGFVTHTILICQHSLSLEPSLAQPRNDGTDAPTDVIRPVFTGKMNFLSLLAIFHFQS